MRRATDTRATPGGTNPHLTGTDGKEQPGHGFCPDGKLCAVQAHGNPDPTAAIGKWLKLRLGEAFRWKPRTAMPLPAALYG